MSAGEIIIKMKLATEDFKKQLDEAKNVVKEKGEQMGNVFSKVFSKIAPKLKTIVANVFSKLTSIVGTMLKVVKAIASGILSLGLGLGAVSLLLGGLVAGALILAGAFEKLNVEQIRVDIQYLIFAIKKSLEPAVNSVANVIQKILNWLVQIIRYTALFISLLVGRNIFEGATAEAFAESMASAEKSTKQTAKNAKEIKKQLAGFDEMNVLSDNKGGGADTGTSGISTPSFDLSNLADLEVPEWMKWIVDNKDLVIAGLLGIAGALLVVKLGLTGLFGGVIVGLIIALAVLIIQNWDKIKEVLGKVWSWIDENIIQPVVALFLWLWDKIVEIFSPIISFIGEILSVVWQTITNIISTIWNNIKTIITNIITIVKTLWNTIISILKPIANWIWNNVLSPVVNFFKGIISTIWGLIKTIATTVGDVIGSAFKGVINGVLWAIENILNFPIRAINKLIKTINKIPGIDLGTLQTFSLPRLAKGGIINMPGRGVPVGNAIAGERGHEAVLPLTDSQQMALLGEAIGKYININATIPVYVGNRQIAREIRKIEAENDFAYNG